MHRPIVLALFLTATSALAGDDDHHEKDHHGHDAHVHGTGHLTIAADGGQLRIALEVPAADIVGFEHEPSNDAQRDAIANALVTLEDVGSVISLPESAACVTEEAAVDLERDHDHAAFHAEYSVTCGDAGAIADVSFPYFERFPGAKELDVEAVSGKGALAEEVERDSATLDLGALF